MKKSKLWMCLGLPILGIMEPAVGGAATDKTPPKVAMLDVLSDVCIANKGDAHKIEQALSGQQNWQEVMPNPILTSEIVTPESTWLMMNDGNPLLLTLNRRRDGGETFGMCGVAGAGPSINEIERFLVRIGAIKNLNYPQDGALYYDLNIEGDWFVLTGDADKSSSNRSIQMFDAPD